MNNTTFVLSDSLICKLLRTAEVQTIHWQQKNRKRMKLKVKLNINANLHHRNKTLYVKFFSFIHIKRTFSDVGDMQKLFPNCIQTRHSYRCVSIAHISFWRTTTDPSSALLLPRLHTVILFHSRILIMVS